MTKPANRFKLFLCKCTGEDDFILRKSSSIIRTYFAVIGTFVNAIFIGCFVSAYVFTHSLFQGNIFISIPVGIIWAIVVVNMYLLLLYTVAPPILPQREQHVLKIKSFFTFSMFFRIAFISLLAIIIAQPLNVELFDNKVESSLAKHIVTEKTKMIVISDSILIKREADIFKDFNSYVISKSNIHEIDASRKNLSLIEQKINEDVGFMHHSNRLLDSIEAVENNMWLTSRNLTTLDSLVNVLSDLVYKEIESDHQFIGQIDQVQINNSNLQQEFLKCKNNLKKAIQDKIDNYNALEILLSRSNFFIKKIQLILHERQEAWFLTLFIILLFILPIILKYDIRNRTTYYKQKIYIEHKIVVEEYENFKSRYASILQKNVNSYNIQSMELLQIYLQKLESIHVEKFTAVKQHVEEEYKNEIFQKYEYWADNPFRTTRRNENLSGASEKDFINFIYPEQS